MNLKSYISNKEEQILATVISIFIELQLSSKVECYSKYPMMHSSRATDGDKPVHSPMTSLEFLKGQTIPSWAGLKERRGVSFHSPRSWGAAGKDKFCLARDGMPTRKAPVKENIKKSVRKCFL